MTAKRKQSRKGNTGNTAGKGPKGPGKPRGPKDPAAEANSVHVIEATYRGELRDLRGLSDLLSPRSLTSLAPAGPARTALRTDHEHANFEPGHDHDETNGTAPMQSALRIASNNKLSTSTTVQPLERPVIEIAIGGRSNVGKSTLVNRLTGRRALARTSKTPGRTRGLIVYDLLVSQGAGQPRLPLRLVDLPGYGYAKVSKGERAGWGGLVEGYVQQSPGLGLVLALVDGRRGVQDEELELLTWLAGLSVMGRIVATKIDKLTAGEKGLLPDTIKRSVAGRGVRVPPVLPVSGQTGEGVQRLWRTILRAAHAAQSQQAERAEGRAEPAVGPSAPEKDEG